MGSDDKKLDSRVDLQLIYENEYFTEKEYYQLNSPRIFAALCLDEPNWLHDYTKVSPTRSHDHNRLREYCRNTYFHITPQLL